jgi:hypothetical protein
MRFSFDVGKTETHRVDFSWSWMTGALRILADGAVVTQHGLAPFSPSSFFSPLNVPNPEKWQLMGFLEVQLVQRWTFGVGTEETHQVTIEKERTKVLAPFRPQEYRVFIDGDLVDRRRGF